MTNLGTTDRDSIRSVSNGSLEILGDGEDSPLNQAVLSAMEDSTNEDCAGITQQQTTMEANGNGTSSSPSALSLPTATTESEIVGGSLQRRPNGLNSDIGRIGEPNDDEKDKDVPPPRKNRVGRWTLDEKILFLYGLQKYGKGRWKKISTYVPDRSLVQIKSHAQKVLKRLDAGENVFRRLEENCSRLHHLVTDIHRRLGLEQPESVLQPAAHRAGVVLAEPAAPSLPPSPLLAAQVPHPHHSSAAAGHGPRKRRRLIPVRSNEGKQEQQQQQQQQQGQQRGEHIMAAVALSRLAVPKEKEDDASVGSV